MRRVLPTLLVFICLYSIAMWAAAFGLVGDDGVAALAFASGVALAAFLLAPRNLWWILGLALLAADVAVDTALGKIDFMPNLVFSLSLIGQAALAAWIVERVRGVPFRLSHRADVEALLLWGALLAPAVGAIAPALASWRWLDGDLWSVYLRWGSSSAFAVVVWTPVLLLLDEAGLRFTRGMSRKRRMEFGFILVVICVVTAAVFRWANPDGATLATFSFLLLPLLMWMALRFGIPGTAIGGLVLACVALAFEGTSSGTSQQVIVGLLSLEAFLLVVLTGGLMVAGLVADRDEVTRSLESGLQRLELATEGADMGAWNWFCKTGEFIVDDRWLSMFGYRTETFTATMESIEDLLHPEDRRVIKKEMEAHFEGRSRLFEMEFRLRTGSGEFRWVSARGKLVVRDADGAPELVAGTHLDIDDRKRLEGSGHLLGQLMETAIAEVYLVDEASLALVEVSRGARENLGYSAEELMAMTALDVMPALTRTDFDALVRPLREKEKAEVRFEQLHVRKDGSNYVVEVVLQLLAGIDRSLYFADVRDVTDRKAAEDQLRQAQKMEAVGHLTGGLAHDFNNLLHVIIGNLDLLIDGENTDTAGIARFAASARSAAERGAELTHSLLAFSRQQPLEPKSLDLNRLVVRMEDLLHRSLGETIEIETVLLADLWTTQVDTAQVESALLNLAVNARDGLPDGGRLTIETSNVQLGDDYAAANAGVAPGEYVLLRVSDNGIGMSTEVRNQAFEPFFTTKAVGSGTGLGLAMIYGFCMQSGGHARIDSELGQGTSVQLYFPRQTRSGAEPSIFLTGPSQPGQGESVLVLEDDETVRNLTVRLLEEVGYFPIGVADRDAAVEVARSADRIDVFLTDMVLTGGHTGASVAAEIAAIRPGVSVLYMSGYTLDPIIHNTSSDSAVVLLQKPFRRTDLAQKVGLALELGAERNSPAR